MIRFYFKSIIILLIFFSSFSAFSIHPLFTDLLDQYIDSPGNIFHDEQIKLLLDDIRSKGIPNSGFTDDCEFFIEIRKSISELEARSEAFQVDYQINELELSNLFRDCGLIDAEVYNEKVGQLKRTDFDYSNFEKIQINPGAPIQGLVLPGVRFLASNLTTFALEKRGYNGPRVSQWIKSDGLVYLKYPGLKAGDIVNISLEDQFGRRLTSRDVVVGQGLEDGREAVLNIKSLTLEPYSSQFDSLKAFGAYTLGEPNLLIQVYGYSGDLPENKSEHNLGGEFSEIPSVLQDQLVLEFELNSVGAIGWDENFKTQELLLSKEFGNKFIFFAKSKGSQKSWKNKGSLFGREFTLFPKLDPDGVERINGYLSLDYLKFDGDLFEEALPKSSDVRQGQINNCYFAAAMQALAHYYPEALKNDVIKPNPDGSFSVGMFATGFSGNRIISSERQYINVSPYFLSSSAGVPLYMSGPSENPFNMILWPPLLEKAFAVMQSNLKSKFKYNNKVTYESIGVQGQGLVPSVVLNFFLDGQKSYMDFHGNNQIRSVSEIKEWILNFYDFKNNKFKNPVFLDSIKSGPFVENYKKQDLVVANHHYVVMGYDKDSDSLLMSNPWGIFEPNVNKPDELDDGYFLMSFDQVLRNFKMAHAFWTID